MLVGLSVNAVPLAAATAAGAVEVYCVCALQKAKTTKRRHGAGFYAVVAVFAVLCIWLFDTDPWDERDYS